MPDIRVVIAVAPCRTQTATRICKLMRAAVANRMGDRIQFVGRVNRIEKTSYRM